MRYRCRESSSNGGKMGNEIWELPNKKNKKKIKIIKSIGFSGNSICNLQFHLFFKYLHVAIKQPR